MRVTTNMMSNIFIHNMQKQTEGMLSRQEQIATQKRINRPSDDPAGMARVLDGRSMVAAIDQYNDNITQGVTRLQFSDEILNTVGDLLKQAQSLAENNSGNEVTSDQRQLAADQVKEIYDQVMQLANSKFGGRYMFSGYQTDTAPFSRAADYTPDTYQGDDGVFTYPVADGIQVAIDADGSNYFGDQVPASGDVNVFVTLHDLITGLENSDLAAGAAQIQATVDPLQDARTQINNKRTEYGSKLYRLQASQEHLQNLKPAIQDAIGRDEDADMAQAIIELQNLQTGYQATMSAVAQILQPSLVNFLK